MKLISPVCTDKSKPNLFKLSDQVTKAEILQTKNYGDSEHEYRGCWASKKKNGFGWNHTVF